MLVEREQRHGVSECAVEGIGSVVRIGEIWKPDLRCLQVRRSADGCLQRSALPGVVRLIEDAVRSGDKPFRVALDVPRQADARRNGVLFRLNQAGRNSRIAGIKQARGRSTEYL